MSVADKPAENGLLTPLQADSTGTASVVSAVPSAPNAATIPQDNPPPSSGNGDCPPSSHMTCVGLDVGSNIAATATTNGNMSCNAATNTSPSSTSTPNLDTSSVLTYGSLSPNASSAPTRGSPSPETPPASTCNTSSLDAPPALTLNTPPALTHGSTEPNASSVEGTNTGAAGSNTLGSVVGTSTTAEQSGSTSTSAPMHREANPKVSSATAQPSISSDTPTLNSNAPPAPVVTQSNQTASATPFDPRTHAGRNPSQPVIPPTHSYKKPKVDKATKAAKKKIRDEDHKALVEDILSFLDQQDNELEELAKTHNRTKKYIEDLINNETHYKKKREINLQNAKNHWKSVELNADRPPGSRAKLPEIVQAVQEDPTLGDDMSEERRDEILKALKAHRELKAKGARINNRAANHDFQETVTRMNKELSSLGSRTGAIGFGLFARSHINDSILSTWIASDDAEKFVSETFGMTMGELSRKFDAWAVGRSSNEQKEDTLLRLQAECSKIILEGLREKVNKPTIQMSYAKYDTDIRLIHRVQLRGWPANIKFAPPATIAAKADVLLLRDALRDGECIWVMMTTQEVNELKTKLKEGVIQHKKRATRKDKGGTHNMQKGKRKRSDENEDPNTGSRPAKKAKMKGKAKSQLPPLQKAPTPLSDSDEDDP